MDYPSWSSFTGKNFHSKIKWIPPGFQENVSTSLLLIFYSLGFLPIVSSSVSYHPQAKPKIFNFFQISDFKYLSTSDIETLRFEEGWIIPQGQVLQGRTFIQILSGARPPLGKILIT